MTGKHLDWDNLRYFLAVARAGKLTVAARRLGQVHTTVGRRISALEAGFGSKLFERRLEGYHLTEAGQRLFHNAEVVESSVCQIQRDLMGNKERIEGTVRVGAPDEFGSLFLATHIGEMRRLHPNLKIELIVSPHAMSVSKREVDISIAHGRPTEGRLFARKLVDYELRIYAVRSYFETHSPIETPSDLSRQTWIDYGSEFIPAAQLGPIPRGDWGVTPQITCSSLVGQLTATLSGAGISMLPRYIADREPSLIPILDEIIKTTRPYHMIVHEDLRDLPTIRIASDFIARRVAEARSLFMPSVARSELGGAIASPRFANSPEREVCLRSEPLESLIPSINRMTPTLIGASS
jgi:DNA-binding transcriptional LysR family regulator